jgi:predicted nucleic acid-binding protein
MKVYLDNCALQRPLDNRNQIRIALEAEAIVGIFTLCELGKVELVSSEVLVFEAQSNPHLTRQEYAFEVLAKAIEFIQLTEEIEKRAKKFNETSIRPLDALHLASAEEAKVDYFCTCDDKFLKKAKAFKDIKAKVVSPLELIQEIER